MQGAEVPNYETGAFQLARRENDIIPETNAFRLYDTYGLPRDFIEDVVRDARIRSRLGRLRQRHAGAAHTREGLLERRAQGIGQSRLRQTRGNIQDRAGLLLRHGAARLPHRSHHHQTRRGKRDQEGRGSRNRSRPHLHLFRIRADRSPTPADSTTNPNRSKSPKSAAHTIRSPGSSPTGSSPRKICTWAIASPPSPILPAASATCATTPPRT